MNAQAAQFDGLWAVVLVRPLGGTYWHEVTRFRIPFDGILRVAAGLEAMTFAEAEVGYGISALRYEGGPCISVHTNGQMLQPIDTVNLVVDIGTSVAEDGVFNFGLRLGPRIQQLTHEYHRMIAALPATIPTIPMPPPPAPAPARVRKAAPRKRAKTMPPIAPARMRKA